MRWILAAVCQLGFFATALGAERPNIVLLYADDMGYGDLAIQNPESKIPTPHLDQLARQGLRFTDAHSSSGICTPSRYALLTGRYHWRKLHGIVNSFGQPVIDEARLTLPEMLREHGYRTACIGKWHLGWDWAAIRRPGAKPRPIDPSSKANRKRKAYAAGDFDWSQSLPGGPLDHGFDHYFGDDVPNFPPYAWFEDDRVLGPPNVPLSATPPTAEGAWEARPGPMVEGWRLDKVMPELTSHAVQWIKQQAKTERDEQQQSEPFFLYFPFTAPHAPIVPTDEFKDSSQAGGYGDFVTQVDDTVGQVLKALEASGFADNTLVIFTCDNGPEHYAFERIRKFEHRSMGPLRGVKRDIWEGGHRVPTIVRWPGKVPAGEVSDALVSQIDTMATLAELIGHELPAGAAEDSHSLLPLLQGAESSPRKSLVHNTRRDHYAIRQGDWLLIDAPSGDLTRRPEWYRKRAAFAKNPHPGALYNLREDLGQRTNLYAKHPDRVAQMKKLLAQTRQQGEVRP